MNEGGQQPRPMGSICPSFRALRLGLSSRDALGNKWGSEQPWKAGWGRKPLSLELEWTKEGHNWDSSPWNGARGVAVSGGTLLGLALKQRAGRKRAPGPRLGVTDILAF